jgi:hypothetical protein
MRKRTTIILAIALVLAALDARVSPLRAQEPPAALVVKLQGDVSIRHGGATAAAVVGARLEAGDEVIPAAGARAYVVHRSGQTQVVSERTTIAAPPAAAPGDAFSRTVRVLAQAATSNARTQPNRQGMIRPIPGEPVLVAPRNGIKVSGLRPTFSWMAVDGASGYTLQLRAEGERPRRWAA